MCKTIDVNGRFVSSFAEMIAVADKIQSANGLVSLNIFAYHNRFDFQTEDNYIKGLAFALETGEVWYIPLRQGREGHGIGEHRDVIVNYFKEILETKEIVCYYSKFLHKAFMYYGIRLNVVEDTFVLANSYLHYYDQPEPYAGHQSALAAAFLDLSIPVDPPYDGTETDLYAYYCSLAVVNLRLMMDVFRDSVFYTSKAYRIDVAFSLACAYSEYFGMHFLVLKKDLQPGESPLNFVDCYRFPKIRYTSPDGMPTVSKPDYHNFDAEQYYFVTGRNGFYMGYGGYTDLYARVLAFMINGPYGKEVLKCSHDYEHDLFTQLAAAIYNTSGYLITEDKRAEVQGLIYAQSMFISDPDHITQIIYHEVTPETKARYAQLMSRFMKVFNDPFDYFSAYVGEVHKIGHCQSYFGRYFRCNEGPGSQQEEPVSEELIRIFANIVVISTTLDVYKMGINRLMEEIYRRGWFGKVLLPGFLKKLYTDFVLMEIENTISPKEFLAVFKEAFLFDIDGGSYFDYKIGFGKNWLDAQTIQLDPDEERIHLSEIFTWERDIRKFTDSVEELREYNG